MSGRPGHGQAGSQVARVLDHAEKVDLANTEEFTFRSFFMAAASELLDAPRFQTEWGTFDLLVQSGDTASLIEFKYYLLRRTYRLDGSPGPKKGGAGPKNEREFGACLDKLRNTIVDGIDQRRLVLVYERDDHLAGRGSGRCTAATANSQRQSRLPESGHSRTDRSKPGF
jgi:hypothetical protein